MAVPLRIDGEKMWENRRNTAGQRRNGKLPFRRWAREKIHRWEYRDTKVLVK